MKHRIAFIFFVALLFSQGVAQESSKSLASTLDVSVFPADGQAADQQSKNEAECYSWAGGDTGNDPFELQKQTEQELAQAESAAKGAVKGAAAGAVIGEVTGGDAGDSAAIGAVADSVSSRRRGRKASQQAQQQAKEQEAAQEKSNNFKNAFSVCLEAKEYMVKF